MTPAERTRLRALCTETARLQAEICRRWAEAKRLRLEANRLGVEAQRLGDEAGQLAQVGDNRVDQEHKKDASRPPRAGAA